MSRRAPPFAPRGADQGRGLGPVIAAGVLIILAATLPYLYATGILDGPRRPVPERAAVPPDQTPSPAAPSPVPTEAADQGDAASPAPAEDAADPPAPEADDLADCLAPRPVCEASRSVLVIAGATPLASAVLIASDVLVTTRQTVADARLATVTSRAGDPIQVRVTPSAFPDDAILVQAPAALGPPPLGVAEDPGEAVVHAIGAIEDGAAARVAVLGTGRLIARPGAAAPWSRLHHDIPLPPSAAGGALVDGSGRLLGVLAGTGARWGDAIPMARIGALRAASGPRHARDSRRLGLHHRLCGEALAEVPEGPTQLSALTADALSDHCAMSLNRPRMDRAAEALALSGRLHHASALFEHAHFLDPNAPDSLIGLALIRERAGRHAEQADLARDLLSLMPGDETVLSLAVRAGALSGAEDLTRLGIEGLERLDPELAARARLFVTTTLGEPEPEPVEAAPAAARAAEKPPPSPPEGPAAPPERAPPPDTPSPEPTPPGLE